ncbi:hypothetical protein DERF_004182 [Dermatophagoides farinae]|uniref:Uncharacterized protein n=1 Tax=Dermatophagoides farinae TaxID=6954 RepID=A0A922I1E6_DERFA|nr:hypothetical protein DERF_004182 [Dermatophagoides farinae]
MIILFSGDGCCQQITIQVGIEFFQSLKSNNYIAYNINNDIINLVNLDEEPVELVESLSYWIGYCGSIHEQQVVNWHGMATPPPPPPRPRS